MAVAVAGWPWPGGRGRAAPRVAVAGWPGGRGRVAVAVAGAMGRMAGWPDGRVAGWPPGWVGRWAGGRVWPGGRGRGRMAGWPGFVGGWRWGGGAFLEDDCNLLTADFKQYQAAFCCPVCGARLLEQIYHICLNQKHRFVC